MPFLIRELAWEPMSKYWIRQQGPKGTENPQPQQLFLSNPTTSLSLGIPSTQNLEGRSSRQGPQTGPGKGQSGRSHEKGWPSPTEQPRTDERQCRVGHVWTLLFRVFYFWIFNLFFVVLCLWCLAIKFPFLCLFRYTRGWEGRTGVRGQRSRIPGTCRTKEIPAWGIGFV